MNGTLAKKSRLVTTGAIVMAMGIVGQVLLQVLREPMAESDLLRWLIMLLALCFYLGPILWLVGMARQIRAAGPSEFASAPLWVPVAIALLLINLVLGVRAHTGNIPQGELLT